MLIRCRFSLRPRRHDGAGRERWSFPRLYGTQVGGGGGPASFIARPAAAPSPCSPIGDRSRREADRERYQEPQKPQGDTSPVGLRFGRGSPPTRQRRRPSFHSAARWTPALLQLSKPSVEARHYGTNRAVSPACRNPSSRPQAPAASLAISSGASIKAVQQMLGHKSASITIDYYLLSMSRTRRALPTVWTGYIAVQQNGIWTRFGPDPWPKALRFGRTPCANDTPRSARPAVVRSRPPGARFAAPDGSR